jgi:hypothetical protein
MDVSLEKNKEKAKNAEGEMLEATKVILTQNNSHEGSLKRCNIHMLKFHPANTQQSIANEILAFLLEERLKKTRKPNNILIKKAKRSIILIAFIVIC